MTHTCPDCQKEYYLEDLNSEDVGAYEDYMGTKVWKECTTYFTPCCGEEPIEKEELEDERDT